MKVFQVNVVLNTGSTGKIVEGINKAIQIKGWQSYSYFGRGAANGSISISFGPNSKLDIYNHVFLTRVFDKHGLGSKRNTMKLVSIINQVNPDIIHLHNIHGYYLNYPLLFDFLSRYGKPVVWTMHDCWTITGHCSHFAQAKCDKWQNICNACPQIKTYPKSIFIDNSTSNFTIKKKVFTSVKNIHIVAVSNWLSTILSKSFLSSQSTSIISNGINLGVFRYFEKKIIDTDKFIILGVASSWTNKKGLLDYIKLSGCLEEDELIVLVGLNEKQIDQLPSNIIGISKTENQHDLACLYSQAGVVVSTSLEESFGMTLIEGFACGTPAIVYDSTALPELITQDTGVVIEPHNIEQLRNSISYIKNSCINYAKTCRLRAEKYYNEDDRWQDYIDLYKRLIENNK